MAVESSPFGIQANTYSAEIVRRAMFNLVTPRGASVGTVAGGVVSTSVDFQMTAPGGILGVNVSTGEGLVPGSSTTTQGGYYFRGSSTTAASIATASASNPRVDLCCCTVNDAAYTGAANTGVIQIITGTPTSGATLSNLTGAPALPTSSMLLGYVLTPANATVTAASMILNNQHAIAASSASASSGVQTGFVIFHAGSSTPTGFLPADGSAVSRVTYSALFGIISTAFGAGNGTTTFNVPNLQGNVAMGAGGGYSLAQTGGETAHTLVTGEIPSHAHTDSGHAHFQPGTDVLTLFTSGSNGQVWNQSAGGNSAYPTSTNAANIQNTGGGGGHNNLQPYIVFNAYIKT